MVQDTFTQSIQISEWNKTKWSTQHSCLQRQMIYYLSNWDAEARKIGHDSLFLSHSFISPGVKLWTNRKLLKVHLRLFIAEFDTTGAGKEMKQLPSQIIQDYATNYTKANQQETQVTIAINSISIKIHRIKWFKKMERWRKRCNREAMWTMWIRN